MKITRGRVKKALKVVLYGPEGIGKSTLAAQFPGAVFIDTEDSTVHMDVARFDKASSWEMLKQQADWVRQNPKEVGTLVVDTADWAEQMEIEDLCKKKGWDAKNRFGLADELPLEYASIAHILQTPAPAPQAAPEPAPAPAVQKAPAPSPKPGKQMSLVDVESVSLSDPIGVNDPPSDEDFFATEATYYRQNEIVYRFMKGERIPIRLLNNSAPSSEEEYRTYLKKKAQEDIRTVQAPLESTAGDAAGAYQEPDMRIPKKLRDLMITNKIEEWEIKNLVGSKGYFPADMPVADYPPDFIEGWCIGYWDQVKSAVMQIREKQAYEFK